MEYTFRSSFRSEVCTLILSESDLIIRSGNSQFSLPYLRIEGVQITKRRAGQFQTILSFDQDQQVLITNQFFTSPQKVEDRSRAYGAFIRVLHFHLKDKSKAEFMSGSPASKIGMLISVAMVVSFAFAFITHFAGIQWVDPFVGGLILSAFSGVIILVSHVRDWPKSYSPSDIPLEFLP